MLLAKNLKAFRRAYQNYRAGSRYYAGRYFQCMLVLFGHPVHLNFASINEVKRGRRNYGSISVEVKGGLRSVLYQHYHQGYTFDRHTDLKGSNRVVWVLLQKAQEGGDLYVDGPCRHYFAGRVKTFDGGRSPHGVTKLVKGSRRVLMFQHGSYDRS